jgi:transcriptional regulator with XRE-family HTH domain
VENKAGMLSFSTAVNSAFGARLRTVRRSRDLSQDELAARMGLSRATVATIEGGKQNIQLNQMFLMARALDVPVDQLVPTLPEVEQRFARLTAIASNPITASGAMFLEDARALLLQIKKDAYEYEAVDETPDRADGLRPSR